MGKVKNEPRPFNARRSIAKTSAKTSSFVPFYFQQESKLARVETIRAGVPYNAIEAISKRLDNTVKKVLDIIGIPQTTYNRKKGEQALLSSRDSELLLLLDELIDYGQEVFNQETEKFQRWLKKPNLSLGGSAPESLLDTITGINEVRFALNRLESGNLA